MNLACEGGRALEFLQFGAMREPYSKSACGILEEACGAVVLFEKRAGGLRSVAVIALKAVLPEPDNTPAWTAVANVLMPHQLALGSREPVWTELLKFGAYKKQANRTRSRARSLKRAAVPTL